MSFGSDLAKYEEATQTSVLPLSTPCAGRIPALTEAGADVLCLDSSDGYSVHQAASALLDVVQARDTDSGE